MKDVTKIGIVLHVINYSDALKNQLFADLRKKLNSYKNVTINFVDAEQYWKIPEQTICCFSLIFEVKDEALIEKLPGLLGVKSVLLLGNNDKFIWDKKCDGGIFLEENVEWVKAYFWQD